MLQNVFDQFIEGLSIKTKETTASSYHTLATNHLLYKFKDRDIVTISEDELIRHIMNEKTNHLLNDDKELSTKTIYDITTLVNTLWAFAFKKGYITEKIHINTPKLQKRKIQIFHESETKKLEKYALKEKSPCSIAILLCLYTGLRIGEVCGLRWADIDLKLKTIYISKTAIRTKNLSDNKAKTKIIIGSPKSTASIRTIPIPTILIKYLRKAKRGDNDYITTGTNTLMEPRLLQKRYKTTLKMANVPYKNFHSIRHTFATNAYNNGMGIKILSEILGHASINTTLNLYVHTSMAQKHKEINKIYSTVKSFQ